LSSTPPDEAEQIRSRENPNRRRSDNGQSQSSWT
jgi:hypothetical protein